MADTVGRRFKVILVDEFQDTDAHQWTIFSSLFGQNIDGKRPYLFLIGDPKQAIYGFRGADIRVYGVAKSEADRVYTLDTNFRTDAALIHGLNGVFGRFKDTLDYFSMQLLSKCNAKRRCSALMPHALRHLP